MAWTNSRIFAQTILDILDGTTAIDLDSATADDYKCALYNSTTAPDNTVAAAQTAYAVGQWVVGNEQTSGADWATGGEAIVLPDLTKASAVITWDDDGTNVVSGSNTTVAGVEGCLCYSEVIATPVANQGICYNYFGGPQGVTGGTFTVQWAATGIFTLTLT